MEKKKVPEDLTKMVSELSIIEAVKDHISSDLGGEAVILNLQSGVYFGLNQVGAEIWKMVQEPKTVQQVKNMVLEQFEVEPQQCQEDIIALLQELEKNQLVTVKNDQASL